MKQAFFLLFTFYYTFGVLCLPQSDFSVLPDLPAMYRHCKTQEDKDLTLFDFLKDHLINVDGFFDAHDHGDLQKSHTPVQLQHQPQQTLVLLPSLQHFSPFIFLTIKESPKFSKKIYHFIFSVAIFRPPAF